MARSCVVRFAANRLTLSVKSRHVRRRPHVSLAPSFPRRHFARNSRDLIGKRRSVSINVVDRLGEFGDFAFGFEEKFSFQIGRLRLR